MKEKDFAQKTRFSYASELVADPLGQIEFLTPQLHNADTIPSSLSIRKTSHNGPGPALCAS